MGNLYLRERERRMIDEMHRASGASRSAIVRAAVNMLYEEWVNRGRDDTWLMKLVRRYEVDYEAEGGAGGGAGG